MTVDHELNDRADETMSTQFVYLLDLM